MPRIAPALLSGVLAGLVMGLMAYVVVDRAASPAARPDEAPNTVAVRAAASGDRSDVGLAGGAAPTTGPIVGPRGTTRRSSGGDHWFGRIVDTVQSFGPPATSEYFLLARAGADTELDENVHAVVAMRRLARGGVVLLEREVVFSEGGVRVLHTERIDGDSRRLVWREFLPSGARTWMAEWRVDRDQLQTIAYGWHRPVHEWIDGVAGMVGPLELLDRMRRRQGPLARVDVEALSMVDPSAATVSEVGVRTVDSLEGTVSTAEVRRTDGSLVMDAVLTVDDSDIETNIAIASLRFGEGRTVATPIGEREFHRRRARWKVDSVPAHESVLARIPDRR